MFSLYLPSLLSLASIGVAAPAPAGTSDLPAITPSAWNFVVDSVYSEYHMLPINVDSKTGFLTLANDTHLTLKFDGQGHAIVPGTSNQFNLTDIIMQAQIIPEQGADGFGIKDGILTRNGASSWGICPNSDGGLNVYCVGGESPCHNMIGREFAAVPLTL